MKITAKQLQDKQACKSEVEIFEKEWPNGAQTTLKNFLRAAELGLDLNWFVDEFLTMKQLKECNEKIAPAEKECNEKRVQAWKEYKEKRVQARKEYDEKIAPAEKEYEEKRARILFDILKRKR